MPKMIRGKPWQMILDVGVILTWGTVAFGLIHYSSCHLLITKLRDWIKSNKVFNQNENEQSSSNSEMNKLEESTQEQNEYDHHAPSEVETKRLKLESSIWEEEYQYSLELDLPSKEKLFQLLDLYPRYVLSENDITFTVGILGEALHSLKLLISRDYLDLFIGLYIKIGEKEGQHIKISEIKGIFQPLDEGSMTVSTPTSSNERFSPLHVYFKKQNPELKFEDLKTFGYYRSYTNVWPVWESRLKVFLKVARIQYSAAVIEKECTLVPKTREGSALAAVGSGDNGNACGEEGCPLPKPAKKSISRIIPAHIVAERREYFNHKCSSTQMSEDFPFRHLHGIFEEQNI